MNLLLENGREPEGFTATISGTFDCVGLFPFIMLMYHLSRYMPDLVVNSGLDEKKRPNSIIEVVINTATFQNLETHKTVVIKKSAGLRSFEGGTQMTL